MDTNTVIKYEKIINSESGSKKEVHKDNDLVNIRRNEWVQLQKEYPNLSKTQLREKRPAVYAFLYRNDSNWLNVNSPERQKVETINNRVNWLERDQEILEKVQKVVEDINNKGGKPKRITVKTLGDRIGERALLENHMDKLSKTKEFIEQVSESERDFRLRRVEFVILEMKEKGEAIKEWKVLKKAAIKAEFYDEVRDIIQSYL
ncbi:hypothetical protein SIN01_28840 [Sporolactobacillus inulinus]|nr:hypothetical protein SIN01_28840 [Sporolactobacillus inulinus]